MPLYRKYSISGTTATNVTTVNGLAANVITATSINADAITAAKIADGAIDAATFAANAITATVIATDAITDAKVAADVTIASVTGAVGSVTGNVGGNVVGSVATVTDLTAALAEPTAVPAANASIVNKINFMAALQRNKVTVTATTQSLRNNTDSGDIASSTVSDDGTTFFGSVVKQGPVYRWHIGGTRTGYAKTREEAVTAAQRAFACSQRESKAA